MSRKAKLCDGGSSDDNGDDNGVQIAAFPSFEGILMT